MIPVRSPIEAITSPHANPKGLSLCVTVLIHMRNMAGVKAPLPKPYKIANAIKPRSSSFYMSVYCHHDEDPALESRKFVKSGTVTISGLFPVHVRGCGRANFRPAYLALSQAMVYAIERVNTDLTLLPNITLGYEIYDYCLTDRLAMETALELINRKKLALMYSNQEMPELSRDVPIPPLSQEFFESLDKVDESALARLIEELNINRLQELPDLTSIFFRRRRQQPTYGLPPRGYPTMPALQRSVGLQRVWERVALRDEIPDGCKGDYERMRRDEIDAKGVRREGERRVKYVQSLSWGCFAVKGGSAPSSPHPKSTTDHSEVIVVLASVVEVIVVLGSVVEVIVVLGSVV
ncbi:hypothetical protein QZH41_013708 [Actinostola sp. cb2023]|nr:hypothetical protein QZH41_013708 [Actinostola sp. cb2023]